MDFDINDSEKKVKKPKKQDDNSLNELKSINKETQKELENRLLKESIATSHQELRKFQNQQQKQIDNIKNTVTSLNNKISQLQESNKLLNDSIDNEINNLSNQIDVLLVSKVKMLNETNTKHVNKLDDLINKSQTRFDSFYNKKTWIDRLIFINLGITPVLFLILLYFIFFEK